MLFRSVVDGTFSSAAERRAAAAVAREVGAGFGVVWCEVSDEVIFERLRRRAHDRLEVSDGREELLAQHRARYEPPVGEPGVVQVDAARDLVAEVERVLPLLGGAS